MKRFLPVLALVFGAAGDAAAEKAVVRDHHYPVIPRDHTYVPRNLQAPQRRILYVNGSGAVLTAGASDNSSQNQSTIIGNNGLSQAQIPAANFTPEQWTNLMACVRLVWGPFSMEVTDVDPGDVPHIECVVGGSPEDAGFEPGAAIGGVAPSMNCNNVINERAIVFDFSEVWNGNILENCHTVAQEVAHALNLDHEYYCPDPMTYIFGCGQKTFQDYDAPCGTFEALPACSCGNSTQNSFQMLTDILGPADAIAPTVEIISPPDGANVPIGFTVEAQAADNIEVTKVELWIDGAFYSSDPIPNPFILDTPPDLTLGQHSLEVRAYDNGANIATDTIDVVVGAECMTDDDCEGEDVCVDNGCYSPVGGSCQDNDDCASAQCVSHDGDRFCSQPCSAGDPSSCPDGFTCGQPSGGGLDKCLPGGGGGGCLIASAARGGRAAWPLAGIALALGAAALYRRRRA